MSWQPESLSEQRPPAFEALNTYKLSARVVRTTSGGVSSTRLEPCGRLFAVHRSRHRPRQGRRPSRKIADGLGDSLVDACRDLRSLRCQFLHGLTVQHRESWTWFGFPGPDSRKNAMASLLSVTMVPTMVPMVPPFLPMAILQDERSGAASTRGEDAGRSTTR